MLTSVCLPGQVQVYSMLICLCLVGSFSSQALDFVGSQTTWLSRLG